MKRLFFIIFFIYIIIFCFVAIYAQTPISTIEQLQQIGNDPYYPLNGNYILTNDIDASPTRSWNNGKGFKPIGDPFHEFTGTFDGCNKTIFNLFINRPEESFIGLFSFTYKQQIQNLSLFNFEVKGKEETGSLIGWGGGKIVNCHVYGNISGEAVIGGLIGQGGTLLDCSSSGTVMGTSNVIGGLSGGDSWIERSSSSCIVIGNNSIGGLIGVSSRLIKECYSTGKVTGNKNTGGLAGYNDGTIQNSYSTGIVEGQSCVGGLGGVNNGLVRNCYSTAQVTGNISTGALLGVVVVDYYADVKDCYFDKDFTGWISGPLWTSGRSTDEMMNPETFKNWDYENVWWMIPGKTYPLLRPVRYVGVNIKTAQTVGLPAEYKIIFDEPVRSFTFDDVDLSLSTVEGIHGTLTPDDAPTTITAWDCFTTWTLRLEDASSTTGLIVMRLPVAAAMNAANYPTTESAVIRLPLLQPARGDLNYDGEVNALDRAILIEMILNPQSLWRLRLLPAEYDLNSDSNLDIGDVIAFLINQR